MGRHHDLGQLGREVLTQARVGPGVVRRGPEQVQRVLGHDRHAVGDGAAAERHDLDLAELDAVPAQLDLGVAPPAELQAPVTAATYDVAGAVEPFARPAVDHEALGGQLGRSW